MISAPTEEQLKEAKKAERLKHRNPNANPVVTDVNLEISSIFKKQMAPKGYVFFICTLTHKKIKYTRAIRIKRAGMPQEAEDQIKHRAKIEFLQSVIEKIGGFNTVPTMKERIKNMITKGKF